MDEERFQKELFEFEKPKKSFPRLSDIFPKPDLDNRIAITLTLERLIFIAIGAVMLMVIIYAMGVESGKNYAKSASSEETRISLVPQKTAVPAVKKTTAPVKTAVPVKAALQPASKQPASSLDANKPYSIFAATFTNRDNAFAAFNKLKTMGVNAFLLQSGSLFKLCAGMYATKDAGQRDLIRIKKIYTDAYIKQR